MKRAKEQPQVMVVPESLQDAPLSWKDKLLAIIESDPLINGIVALAITIGFFHGWLKIHYRHPAVIFLFDAFLLAALVLICRQQKRQESFLPPSPISDALKFFYLVCGLYFLLPWGPPWLIWAASMRGWCFATLMFVLGYRLTKSLKQVKGYFYVLILLGVITAVYGAQQSQSSVESMMNEDEQMYEKYKTSYYSSSQGNKFRVFSTFISSGMFGNTMAYVLVVTIALMSDKKLLRWERTVLLGAAAPMAYGIMISGSRTSLLLMGFGLLVIAWQRRSLQNFVLIPAAVVLVFKLGVSVSGGGAAERFGTLLKFEEVYDRNLIPTQIGWDYMLENPLGGGLGKAGYSIPFFLVRQLGYTDFYGTDGDLGRLMVEMGFVGVLVFGRVLWVALKTAVKRLTVLQDTPLASVAIASASCFLMAISSLPSGSPFLGIPMGAMVWFLMGTLEKLASEYAKSSKQLLDEDVPSASTKRFLYYRPPKRD